MSQAFLLSSKILLPPGDFMQKRLTSRIFTLSKRSVLFPKDDDNTLIVRTNNSDMNLAILFELTCSAMDVNTDVVEEYVVGWGSLPMFSHATNEKIEKKTYQIMLHGNNALHANPTANQIDSKNISKKGMLHSV